MLFSRHIIEQSSFLEPSSSSDRAERRRASEVAAALLLLRRLRAFAFSVSEKTSSWDLLKRVSPEINRQKLGKLFSHFERFLKDCQKEHLQCTPGNRVTKRKPYEKARNITNTWHFAHCKNQHGNFQI